MLKNIEIHNIPTSKLIYYRVYRATSPFSLEEIDDTLKNRQNILLKDEKNSFRKKVFMPRYISVLEEEEKIKNRGEGLHHFYFDKGKDFYTTFIGMLKSGEKYYESHSPIFNLLDFFNSLTWSEQVLLCDMASKMSVVMKEKNRKTEIAWNILKNVNRPYPLEIKLFSFFRHYPENFRNYMYIFCMNKTLKREIYNPLDLLMIIRYSLLPSHNHLSVFDKTLLEDGITKEKSYIESETNINLLDESMEEIKQRKDEVHKVLIQKF